MGDEIRTKRAMYRAFHRGSFGNAGPSWNTLAEFVEADLRSSFAIRTRRPGGPCEYDFPSYCPPFCKESWRRSLAQSFAEAHHVSLADLHYSECAPDHLITLQGEVQESSVSGLWEMTYSTERAMMRAALRTAKTASGMQARWLIKGHFDPLSYDNLLRLMDTYPHHTIEFTAFSEPWGSVPGCNVVIWEVRRY